MHKTEHKLKQNRTPKCQKSLFWSEDSTRKRKWGRPTNVKFTTKHRKWRKKSVFCFWSSGRVSYSPKPFNLSLRQKEKEKNSKSLPNKIIHITCFKGPLLDIYHEKEFPLFRKWKIWDLINLTLRNTIKSFAHGSKKIQLLLRNSIKLMTQN